LRKKGKNMRAKIVLLLAALCLLFPLCASATDIPIYPTGPVFRLTGLAWGTSTTPGFNNNYYFVPLNVNESVCITILNNNPSNSHTFTASILVSGNPASTSPSDPTWQAAANSSGLFVGASPGIPAAIAAQVSGASQVSINFSGSSVQAGSPDTASVTISQTPGTCFSGNGAISSSPQLVSANRPIQEISDGLSQAFLLSSQATNPGVNGTIALVTANGGNRTLYFDRIVISTTATATVSLGLATGNGTGCSNHQEVNQKLGSAITASGNGQTTCTAGPSTSQNIAFDLTASTPYTVDLTGIIATPGTSNGIWVFTPASVTGTVRATIFWYEK
jgi:hypothetical protein